MNNSTKTKKEKSVSWHGLYVFADKALLPTRIETAQGDFDMEPIQQFDYRNRTDLMDALSTAINTGNPKGEVPPLENKKKPTPMEKHVGAKSWTDLERKSIFFSIKVYPSNFSVKAWGRASNKAWSDEKDTSLDVEIPIEDGVEAIADVILDHLKTRTDLPGLSFGQSQQQTAKGA